MRFKMNMVLLLMTTILISMPTSAQTPNEPKTDPKTETKKEYKRTIPFHLKDVAHKRPQAPSRQSIESYYCDGMLYVEFSIPEGLCTLTVTDNDTQESDQIMFDSSVPSEIYIGEVSDAHFEISTGNGKTYQGDLN